jgi:hypothetical protein
MGYYTTYELDIQGQAANWVQGVDEQGNSVRVNIGYDHAAIEREIVAQSGYSSLFEGESVKWYDHDEEMKAVSKKYPDLLFTLTGVGEESGDMWCKYYQAGKCQHELARIEYGKFDPAKLK